MGSAVDNTIFKCQKLVWWKFTGEGAVKGGNVRKWCWLFTEGRTNVPHEEQIMCPSSVADDLKEIVNARIWENRRFTTSEFYFSPPTWGLRSDKETKYMQDWLKIFVAAF
jgi:hypothetical protein